MTEQKRMAFHEIGRGKFAKWMQEEFERAQKIVSETKSSVTLSSVIKVDPPEKEDDCFGKITFTVRVSRPTRKSANYMTEVDNGVIISDGVDVAEILQETLELPDIEVGPQSQSNGE